MKAKMLKSELNFPLLTLYQLVQEINPISTKGYRLCLHNNTGTHGFSDLPTALIYVLLILGAYKVWQHVSSLVKGIWKHVLRPKTSVKSRYAKSGSEPWVVISGGASGIGKGYAMEMAKEGFNILIIDKNEIDTKETKQKIEGFGVKCSGLIYDFGNLGNPSAASEFIASLNTAVKGKDVCVLFNNVAEFQHEAFADTSLETIFRATNVNCHAQAVLCQYFLKKLISRPVRSAIVNIGTNAAEPQNPRYKFALYGATKSYNHILSSGLEEWYGDKIDIMTVMPRQTKTKMNPANYLFTVTPETHAKAVIDQLGSVSKTYGPMIHDFEYQMRFVYFFGIFDTIVQWCNKSRSENMIKHYEIQKKIK